MNHYRRGYTYSDVAGAGLPEDACAVCSNPWPCEAARERVTRAEVDEVIAVINPRDPVGKRSAAIVERLARAAGVR